jgi:hypothetical protein
MGRPTLMVLTLLVLWLIVLVPMIFRSVDGRAQQRSVRRFGRSMGLLNRGHAKTGGRSLRTSAASAASVSSAASASAWSDFTDVTYVQPRITAARDELFVSGSPGRIRSEVDPDADLEVAVRRPTPAAQEAQMYPVDRADMSDARRHMMRRRRRSLTILGVGTFVGLLLAFTVGGTLFAVAATLFSLGLGGYLYFLRSQALHDRERREHRLERSDARRSHEHDVEYETDEAPRYVDEPAESMVHIDDDSIDLHNLDTIDLTGLYAEEGYEPASRRRAS